MTVLNAIKNKTLTGAQIITETLKALDVDCVFGYPGGVVLGLYDALYNDNAIKHYLVRHEQAAVHAAEGFSRVTGKCGVVIVTSGPGAANIVSAVSNAYMDGYPVLVLTGQVAKYKIGTDAFQEINIVDITKSCTKAGFQVVDVNDIEATLIKAYNCAMEGKKGPVVVDLSQNIFNEKCMYKGNVQISKPKTELIGDSIKGILEVVQKSEAPVVVVGGGVQHSKAFKELYTFAKTLNIPVVSTMMGIGCYPQEEDNFFGMIGLFGTAAANCVVKNSDLIISLGARFNDRITACFKNGELTRKLIQIDINEKEISRIIPAYKYAIGDIREFLIQANRILTMQNYKSSHEDWLMNVQKYRALNRVNKPISDNLQGYEVIQEIYDFAKGKNYVVSTEVGQHQMLTVQNYKISTKDKFLTSGGSGTMGFGFPAAIGASIATDYSPVICIAGDGSFQMNEQELATCVDYNIPVKIFIMNNGYLGMVRQIQQGGYGKRYFQTKISNPDYIKLAQAYGIKAERVDCKKDIRKALVNAFSVNEPYIIDFIIEPFETV